MASAWEFVDRSLTDELARNVGHGPSMVADAESHSIALATIGALLFEWDAVNDRVARPAGLRHLYGYAIEEIEPSFLWLRNLIHPDDISDDRARLLEQIAARAPIIRGQYRVQHKEGRWITVKTSGAAEYDASGRLLRMVGCTIDTDEADILEEAHARLAAVVGHSNDAILSIDAHGLISTWNAGATRLYGYEAADIVGKPLATLVPEEDLAAAQKVVDDILSGTTHVFQAMRRARDGQLVAIEISGAPIRSPDGRVLGISAIHRNVTDARRTALGDARFAAVVGASHDAIITIDAQGQIENWNKGAEELFGWPATEAVGQPIAFLVPDDQLEEHETLALRLLAGESVTCETERVTRDGLRVSVLASFSPFLHNGEHEGSAVTFRDIGDRLARESHIHMLLKELSHRSKNLLAVVQGIARQSAMRTPDFKMFIESFSARLRALAHAHDLIVQKNWHGADMHALIAMQTGAFEIAADVLRLEGKPLLIKPEAAQNIGLSLHELASNALRYGALSTPGGYVRIAWAFVDRDGRNVLRMTWREFGGPAATLPRRSGFGFLVLTQITPSALGGKANMTTDDNGLVWTLEAPADNIIGPTS